MLEGKSMKKNRTSRIITTVVMAFVLFIVVISAVSSILSNDPKLYPGDKLAMVDIRGAITSSEAIANQLRTCREDRLIKAVVLRIDSPGGVVAPVQEIYREVMKLKKPVVVSMGSIAASGGYYIAAAGDHVFANPGTLTGSIGVLMQFPKWGELMKKIGVKQEVVKSGKFKDTGSMYRELTPEERALFQETIDDVYDQFLEAILEGRKHANLTREKLLTVADGRVMSGRQALENKLVDELGGLDDAIQFAGKLARIKGTPKVVRMNPPRPLLERLTKHALGSYLGNLGFQSPALRYELMP